MRFIAEEERCRRQDTVTFARAFAMLVVVVGLGDTVAAQTCTSFAVDTAEHRSESSSRSLASFGRSPMGWTAVSLQPNSCRGHVADIRAVRLRARIDLSCRDRPSVDSGTGARSCSCTAAGSRPHRMQRDGGDVLPRVLLRVTHPR